MVRMNVPGDNRKISEMRNLGPACERDLNAVGIHTAADVIRLGTVDTFMQMLVGRAKEGRAAEACNAAYLYAIYGAIHDLDWLAIPAEKKAEFKTLTAEIRASKQFR